MKRSPMWKLAEIENVLFSEFQSRNFVAAVKCLLVHYPNCNYISFLSIRIRGYTCILKKLVISIGLDFCSGPLLINHLDPF